MITFLDMQTLVNFSETSRYFNKMCNIDYVWKKLIFNTFGIDVINGNHQVDYYTVCCYYLVLS
jgi:hypothetical protein